MTTKIKLQRTKATGWTDKLPDIFTSTQVLKGYSDCPCAECTGSPSLDLARGKGIKSKFIQPQSITWWVCKYTLPCVCICVLGYFGRMPMFFFFCLHMWPEYVEYDCWLLTASALVATFSLYLHTIFGLIFIWNIMDVSCSMVPAYLPNHPPSYCQLSWGLQCLLQYLLGATRGSSAETWFASFHFNINSFSSIQSVVIRSQVPRQKDIHFHCG